MEPELKITGSTLVRYAVPRPIGDDGLQAGLVSRGGKVHLSRPDGTEFILTFEELVHLMRWKTALDIRIAADG
jgi:hypothetical protein